MSLTGKCKEDFEEWYKVKYYPCHYGMTQFNELNNSKQYGVYEDFFDDVGIYIQITPYFEPVKEVQLWFFTFENKKCIHLNNHTKNGGILTRPEARIKAIEKANELYNQNK